MLRVTRKISRSLQLPGLPNWTTGQQGLQGIFDGGRSVLAGGCWGPGGGAGVRFRGGVFHAFVRKKEKVTLKAMQAEAKLRRKGISRFNKRWRSWAQNRLRQWDLQLPVTITSETQLMDTQYISTCVQKAAALRKHDLQLWYNYSQRILELKNDLLPEQLGYILWGYGKSSYLNETFYRGIAETVKQKLPEFQSHAIMSLMWCLGRINWYDQELIRSAAQHLLEIIDTTRPSDFIKVANACAALGLKDPNLKASLSKVAIAKFEEAMAQQFRDAVNPVAVGCLWSDEVTLYLLERFRRVFITARPQHLMKAFESAVVCRVHAPQVWKSLSYDAKQFYVRLSQRYIPDKGQEPSTLHWDVSRHLADLGEAHRNAFRWGPFQIDIGLEELESDERRRCLMIDSPTAFFFGTDRYLPAKQLRHKMLSSLGWDVHRIRWDDWAELELDADKKRDFLQSLLKQVQPVGDDLHDRSGCTSAEFGEKLKKFKNVIHQTKTAEREARESTIDLDL